MHRIHLTLSTCQVSLVVKYSMHVLVLQECIWTLELTNFPLMVHDIHIKLVCVIVHTFRKLIAMLLNHLRLASIH